jgi:succinate dehydrogenase/fumarate reductase flavoprotein subunit
MPDQYVVLVIGDGMAGLSAAKREVNLAELGGFAGASRLSD